MFYQFMTPRASGIDIGIVHHTSVMFANSTIPLYITKKARPDMDIPRA